MPRLLFIVIVIMSFFLSCKKSYKNQCPIPTIEEITSKVYSENFNSTYIVNHLNANGYVQEALDSTRSEPWGELIYVHIHEDIDLEGVGTVPINEKIDSIFLDSDIIMLNETHDLPDHRVFAQSLLVRLKEQGYTYIAIEALNSDPNVEIIKSNYATNSSSIYVKNYFYANFINEAVRLGFEILSYEPIVMDNRRGRRDKKMSLNIKEKWNPEKGKLFIYCGWSHLEKREYWLRDYLDKQYPSLKIRSINEVWLNPDHPLGLQEKLRKKLNDVKVSSFLMRDNEFFTLKNTYDFELIHPVGDSFNDRMMKLCSDYKLSKLKITNHEDFNYLVVYPFGVGDDFCSIIPSYVTHDLKEEIEMLIPVGKYKAYLCTDKNIEFFKTLEIKK